MWVLKRGQPYLRTTSLGYNLEKNWLLQCAPSPPPLPGEISHLLSLLGKLISKKWLSCQQSFLSIIFSLNSQLSHFNNAHLLTSSFLSPSAFFSIEACLCYEKERKEEIKIKWIETASRLSHSQPKGIAYRTSIICLLVLTSILVQR